MSNGIRVLSQLKRGFKKPIVEDEVFNTLADLEAYLTSELRYAGMIVSCVETEKSYKLNATEDEWVELGSGSGGGLNPIKVITQNSHGLVKGDVCYFNGTSYVKSQGDSPDNAEVDGIVVEVTSVNEFKIVSVSGAEIDVSSVVDDNDDPLTANTVYFLSTTVAGKLTKIPPTTLGEINKNILKTLTADVALYVNDRGMEVGEEVEGVQEILFYRTVTQTSHGFDKDFVYHDGTLWKKAKADNGETTATHFAIAINVSAFQLFSCGDIDVTDMVDDVGAPIVSGDYYFLSSTEAGKVTAVTPTTGISQSVMKVNEAGKITVTIEEPTIASEATPVTPTTVARTGSFIVQKRYLASANMMGATHKITRISKVDGGIIALANSTSYPTYYDLNDNNAVIDGYPNPAPVSKNFIATSSRNIFVLESNTVVWYLKGQTTQDSDSSNLSDLVFRNIAADDTHIFFSQLSSTATIRKYSFDSRSVVASLSLGQIKSVMADSLFVYVSLYNGHIVKLDKATLTEVGRTSAGSNACSIVVDDTHIYALTLDGKLHKINKTTLTNVLMVNNFSHLADILAYEIDIGVNFIYITQVAENPTTLEGTHTVFKVKKEDLSILASYTLPVVNQQTQNNVVEIDDNDFYMTYGGRVIRFSTINNVMEGI